MRARARSRNGRILGKPSMGGGRGGGELNLSLPAIRRCYVIH